MINFKTKLHFYIVALEKNLLVPHAFCEQNNKVVLLQCCNQENKRKFYNILVNKNLSVQRLVNHMVVSRTSNPLISQSKYININI